VKVYFHYLRMQFQKASIPDAQSPNTGSASNSNSLRLLRTSLFGIFHYMNCSGCMIFSFRKSRQPLRSLTHCPPDNAVRAQNNKSHQSVAFVILCSHQGSNLDRRYRKPTFYPLNYESEWLDHSMISCSFQNPKYSKRWCENGSSICSSLSRGAIMSSI
jgi:hypothetical protein